MTHVEIVFEREDIVDKRVKEILSKRLLADQLERHEDWDHVLELLMELAYEYGIYDVDQIESVLYFTDVDVPAEKDAITTKEQANIHFIKALLQYYVSIDDDLFFKDQFLKNIMLAHKKGHKAALGVKSHLMFCHNQDLDMDTFIEEEHMIHAARLGCIGAYINAGEVLRNNRQYFESHYFIKMATMYGFHDQFHRLREYKHMRDASPLGKWMPYKYVHQMVCDEIHREIWTWLLVNNRKQLLKSNYVVLKICAEICT